MRERGGPMRMVVLDELGGLSGIVGGIWCGESEDEDADDDSWGSGVAWTWRFVLRERKKLMRE